MKSDNSTKQLKENMAKASGRDLPISFKQSIEVCNYLRKDPVAKAKQKMEDAISLKKPVPFKKYTDGVGHKKGNILAGRYPVNACKMILKLIKSAESNALFKGLNSKGLIIENITTNQAADAWRYGRQSRRKMKRCHIDVIVKEVVKKKETAKQKPEEKKPEVKTAAEPAEKKESPKPAPAKSEASKPEVKAETAEPKPKIEPKAEVKKQEAEQKPKEEPKPVQESNNKIEEK